VCCRGIHSERDHITLKQVFLRCKQRECTEDTVPYHRRSSNDRLSAFQWDDKGVGSYTSHLVGMKERNKTMLFLYINMPELDSYFKIFDSIYKADQQLTQKELDDLCLKGVHGGPSFVQWFHEHVISSMSIFF
jgi:hypothetical protein